MPRWFIDNTRQNVDRAMLNEQIALFRNAVHIQDGSFVRYGYSFVTHDQNKRERVPQSSLTDPLRSPKNTIVSC